MNKKIKVVLALATLFSLASCNINVIIDKLNSDYEQIMKNTLDAPSFSVDYNGNVTWNKVDYATGYRINLNGELKDLGNVTSYVLDDGDVFSLQAYGNNYKDSKFSDNYTFTAVYKTLNYPEFNVNLIGQVTWKAITGVKYYTYCVNGNEYKTENTTASISYGDTFKIKSLSEDSIYRYSYDSQYSYEIKLTANIIKLETPEISIDVNGKVTWNEISGVSTYGYVINDDAEIKTSNREITINHGDNIKVRALPDNLGQNYTYLASDYAADSFLIKNKTKYTYKDYVTKSVFDIDSIPSIGTSKLLVIPVWFTNSTQYIRYSARNNIRTDIQKAYFGTSSETGWESVASYYNKESFGKVTLDGVVTDWYECNLSSTRITSTEAVSNLVLNAFNWYKQLNPQVDMKDFDSDSNGYIDSVILVYAAPDYDASNSRNETLWAYCNWIQGNNANKANPQVNAYFFASYDFMYSKNKSLERALNSSYHNGDTRFCNIDAHTYIHETGHLFGLEDYYDYSDYEYTPAGGFSMQDFNVGAHDPYSKLALGWIDPYVITETKKVKIRPIEESGDVILVTNEFHDSPFDEYLLIELYTSTGLNSFDVAHQYGGSYPEGVNGYGIRIWHVDARLVRYTSSSSFPDSKMYTDFAYNSYVHAMSNSYKGDYASNLGSSYYNYNLLQLIRNNTSESYKTKSLLTYSDLFQTGDIFSISKFNKQFVRNNALNSREAFNFTIYFNYVGNDYATITITKNS